MPEGCFALRIMSMEGYNSDSVDSSRAADYLKTLDSLFQDMSPLPTDAEPESRAPAAIEAVLFDIYGTLLISEAGDIGLTALDQNSGDSMFTLVAGSLKKSFPFASLKSRLVELIRREHTRIKEADPRVHYPEVDIVFLWDNIFKEEFQDNYSVADVAEAALLFEIMSNRVALMPDTLEILDFIKDKALPLGIVSNAQFYTPLLLEYLTGMDLDGLGFEADHCSWSYQCGCGKPDQRIFEKPLETLKKSGITADKILYVGNDMLNDIATAASLGMKTALFAGDCRSLRLREDDERVSGVSPDFVITRLNQLKQIVQAG